MNQVLGRPVAPVRASKQSRTHGDFKGPTSVCTGRVQMLNNCRPDSALPAEEIARAFVLAPCRPMSVPLKSP